MDIHSKETKHATHEEAVRTTHEKTASYLSQEKRSIFLDNLLPRLILGPPNQV
jgi:hypothetical protein